jgi:3,4-dihydroxy 2-butanone 4-phosphate synthase/GTP cyclohydrolase II
VYLRQEGRGIGLINKLRAYSLQDGGLDTVEANEHLGFPADLRNYGVGAQILSDLGVHRLRLITNNPRKIAGLGGYGLQVEDRVPLVMDPGQHNASYLRTKRTKLGHLIEEDEGGITAVLAWHGEEGGDAADLAAQGSDAMAARVARHYAELEQLAERLGLLIEREDQPRVLALLDQPALAVLLTLREGEEIGSAALGELLQAMAAWGGTTAVSLLLAPDPPRTEHPRADLEPRILPIDMLRPAVRFQPSRAWMETQAGGEGESALWKPEAGTFLIWRSDIGSAPD